MAKAKLKYVCQNCGYTTVSWLGKCPECGTWDSLVEEVDSPVLQGTSRSFLKFMESGVPKTLSSISQTRIERVITGIGEFDRVLGGGIVPGSLVLLGGDPGIGKSTILLDVVMRLSQRELKCLYVSGEESEEQTALRAQRLGKCSASLLLLTATNLDHILVQAEQVRPTILVVDSIQTMFTEAVETAAGSVGQVRECTARLLRFAKTTGIAVLIVGHMTKEGNIAGPRLLEHMVDVVLQFEGDRSYAFRVLRALKNRFGSTNESGIFSMEEGGLKEIANPEGLFLEEREKDVTGAVVCSCLEGNRPILTEFQALVSRTPFGLPRRTAVGIDFNRLNMLIAILEKHKGMDFGTYDAYVNVVGGIRIKETAADLAVIAALVSSMRDKPIPYGLLTFGEVGLTGEIRRVAAPERRIAAAVKLGFKKFVIPVGKISASSLGGVTKNQLLQVRTVTEAIAAIFDS